MRLKGEGKSESLEKEGIVVIDRAGGSPSYVIVSHYSVKNMDSGNCPFLFGVIKCGMMDKDIYEVQF